MKQSDYARRFDAAVAELNTVGVSGSNAMPPYLRIGRKLGFEPRPLHYETFARIAVSSGIYFAVTWGIFMSLVFWNDRGMPTAMQFFTAAGAGLLFGLGMAVWYRSVRRKNGLSSWDDL
jgi:hypothetical protein